VPAEVIRQRPPSRAGVELVGAAARDASQRAGQIRLLKRVAGPVEAAIAQENLFAAGKPLEA
jgi:hypothetical protein